MPVATPKIDALHKGLSEGYDLGTVEEFREKLKDPAKRKVLYDSASKKFELGDYEAYEKKIVSEIAPPTGFWGNVKDAAVFGAKGLWATVTKQIPGEFRAEDLRLSKGVMGDMFDPRSNIRATNFKSKVITPEMQNEFRQFNNSQAVRELGLSKNGKVDTFLKKKFGSQYETKKKEFEKEVVDYRLNIEKDVHEYSKAYAEQTEGVPGDIADVTSDNVGKFIGNLVGQGMGRIPASVATGGAASFVAERAAVFNLQLDKISEKTGLTREEIIKKGIDEPETGRMLADFLGAIDVVSAGSVTGIIEAPFKKRIIRKALAIGGEAIQEAVQGEGEEIGGAMGSGTNYSPDASRILTNVAGGILGSGGVVASGAAVKKGAEIVKGGGKVVTPSDALAPAEKQEPASKVKPVMVNAEKAEIRQTNFATRPDGTEVTTFDTGLTIKNTNTPLSLRAEKATDGTITFSGEGVLPFQAPSIEKAVTQIQEESEVAWKAMPVVVGSIKIEQVSQDQYGTVYNSGLTNKETGEPVRIIKRDDPVNGVGFESENGTIKGSSVEDVAEKIQSAGVPHIPAGGDIKANAIIASEGVTLKSVQRIYEQAFGYTKDQAKRIAPIAMDAVNVRAKEKNVTPEQAFYEIAKMRAVAKQGGNVKDVKAAGEDVVVNKLVKQPKAEEKLKEEKKLKAEKKPKKSKPKKDAVQKQEATEVPVQPEAGGSQEVVQEVQQPEKPAAESSQKVEAPAVENVETVEKTDAPAKAAPSQESTEIFEVLSRDIFPSTVQDLTEAIQEFGGYEGGLGKAKAIARVKQMQEEGVIKVEGKKVTPTLELGDSAFPVSEQAVFSTNAKKKNPIGIVNNGAGFIFETDLSALWKKTKDAFTNYLTTRGFLPKDVFDRWNTTKAEIKKYEAQVAFTVNDLKKAVKEEYKKVSTADVVDMNLYLQKQATLNPIPAKTKRILDSMRAQIDNLSSRFVREGIVAGDLGAKITANMGIYLNRSYRKYDDPNWNAPEEIQNKAMGFIRAKYPQYTDAEAQGLLNYLMQSPEAPMAIIVGGGIGKINLSPLKKRGDIAPEIRALMGEYNDPIANYARSIGKMAALVSKNHFQQDIKRDGVGKYMFEQPTGEFSVKIEAGNTSAFKTATGGSLYTTKEIAAVLGEYEKQQVQPPWIKWLLKNNARINLGLTVLSPTTHSRNFFANTLFALSNGHFGAEKMPSSIAAWQGVNPTDNIKNREKWLEYVQLGIVGDGVTIGVLNDYMKDIREGVDTFNPEPLIGGEKLTFPITRKIKSGAEKLYQFGDNVYKIYAYENEFERYSKAYPALSKEQVKAIAAENVKNTYPTYSRVPKVVRSLKNVPIAGGFISFPSEVVRTTYNTAELAMQEMRSGNKELFKVGAKRMAGLMTAIALPTAMSYATRAMLSMDGDDDKDLRNFLPPWQENSELLYFNKEGSTYTYGDFGPFDPHAILKKPVYAFMRGESLPQSTANTVKEIIAPFTSEQVGTAGAIDVFRNQTPQGRPVYDKNAPAGDQIAQATGYFFNKVSPGFIKSSTKVFDAAKGETNQYGEEYQLTNEILALYPGIRIKTLDIEAASPFKVSEYNRAFDTAEAFYNKEVKFRQNATDEEIEAADERYSQTVTNIFIKASIAWDASMRLGASGSAFTKLKVPTAFIDWERVEQETQFKP